MANPTKPDPFCDQSKMGPSEIVGQSRDGSFKVKLPYGVLNEGHVLLVPSKHFETLGDIPLEMYQGYTDFSSRLQHTLEDAFGKPVTRFEHGGIANTVSHAHEVFVPLRADDLHNRTDDYFGVKEVVVKAYGIPIPTIGNLLCQFRKAVREKTSDRGYLALFNNDDWALYVPEKQTEVTDSKLTSMFRVLVADTLPPIEILGYQGTGNPLADWQGIKDLPAAKERDRELRERTRKALADRL